MQLLLTHAACRGVQTFEKPTDVQTTRLVHLGNRRISIRQQACVMLFLGVVGLPQIVRRFEVGFCR